MYLKMDTSSWINLAVISYLFAVIHESSASDWLKIGFRARQRDARRNRIKYEPDFEKERLDNTKVYPGFITDKEFLILVTPTLYDDKNTGLIQQYNSDAIMVCRKDKKEGAQISQQHTAVTLLESFGKAFYFSPRAEKKSRPQPVRDLILTALTNQKKDEEMNNNSDIFCARTPAPGLKLVTKYAKNVTFQHSGGKYTCNYFEYGLEVVRSSDPDNFYNTKLRKESKWIPVYNLCYDPNNYITSFTKHKINTQNLLHRKISPFIDNKDAEKVFVHDDMDQIYNLEIQRKSFDFWNKKEELNAFHKEKNYLVRAQLVPDHDVIYESWQYANQNYLNYAPQWRTVALGQWLTVEQHIRSMGIYAMERIRELTVYTGVYYKKDATRLHLEFGIDEKSSSSSRFSFTSSAKSKPKLKSIPIPSLFFKYVHTDRAGIVLITANGVSGKIEDITCPDVCEKYKWKFTSPRYQHRNDEESGITKCCEPHEFLKQTEISKSLPDSSECRNKITHILTYDGEAVLPDKSTQKPEKKPARQEMSQQDIDSSKTGYFHQAPKRESVSGNTYVFGAFYKYEQGR